MRKCLSTASASVVAAHRLAGFGAAEFDDAAPGGLVAKVVVETDHAVDFGAGEIERVGDDGDRVARNETELGLQRVQDRQERAFEMRVRRRNLFHAFGSPRFGRNFTDSVFAGSLK